MYSGIFVSGIFVSGIFAQEIETPYKSKKIAISKDTITIEKVSINKAFFKITDQNGTSIDSSNYVVDFKKSTLVFKDNFTSTDTLTIRYLKFPEFLTKSYSIYDNNKVVSNEAGKLYTISKVERNDFKPFDGLTTSGSISRGITVGNNQNTVVNSNLDLQITGKISDNKLGIISLASSVELKLP